MMQLVLSKQRGIALIQVLIIAIILTMLGIFINQSVREQVNITGYIQGNHQVGLLLETVEAELLHQLLTNRRYPNADSENDYVKNWNFYGKPFSINEQVTIEMQDLSGLLSLNYMNQTVANRLFVLLGHEGEEVRIFFDSLKDWKDEDDLKHLNGAESDYYQKLNLQTPRNGYLQSIAEVHNIRSAKLMTMAQWQKYFSLSLVSRFNPLNAPEQLLKAFIDNDVEWEGVMQLRDDKQLNMINFYQMTGIDAGQSVTFSTGRWIRIKIHVDTENNQLSKSFQVELRPNSTKRPIRISDVKWNEV